MPSTSVRNVKMSKTLNYEIGQDVMVPLRGLCTVTRVEEETMLGQTLTFVHLKPKGGKGIIKVPASQLGEQGVRPLVGKEELLGALDEKVKVEDLSKMESLDRLERWTEMLKNSDYGTRIQVLRELALVEKRDQLDSHEKKLMNQVRLAARREIESVLETSAAGAGRKLNEAISGQAQSKK